MSEIGLWKTKEEEEEFLKNLFLEYSFSCHHEKNAEGCQLLGDFYIGFKRDFKTAADIYAKNCEENNFGRSCYLSGSNYLIGKGCEKNREKALEHFKKGCDLETASACFMSGTMLTKSGKATPQDTKKEDFLLGLKNLTKACLSKNGLSCAVLSQMYELGIEGFVEPDMVKALEFSVKACDLNVGIGCVNACRWYRSGQGAPKNDMLADMYKAKGKDIAKQLKSQGIQLQQYT